ncbi:hypothetical protein EMPS_02147 [Entomortierella parvispora]|uniref:Carboxylesterase type B domain-containing protein n=1 Tax=Entomortierella parvispora TaxID=205924 RepID=A0A9P3H480_9FUNG|nr:hypothetical protein EMPS_02147 [Entomortierella parvispora]
MIFNHLFTAVAAAVVYLTLQAVESAPISPKSSKISKRDLLLPWAPVADEMNGTHLLNNNDVDTGTTKRSYILLSQPRSYYDGMNACSTMGEAGYIFIPGTIGGLDFISLLNKNSAAQPEVNAYTQYWVYNAVPGVFSNCLAANKATGSTDWISCSTLLPTVCYNSVMRRVLLFDDTSRQIKVNAPVGQIQGWRDQNAFRFLGIPYAEAPVGDLRWAAPVAKANFTTTWNAIDYGHICPQTAQSLGIFPAIEDYLEMSATQQEDCLNLNVYTPSLKGQGQKLLPVMMYIHGGSFDSYSGSVIIFEPGNLVSRGGVVVVTINYRLGMLGFFENTSNWSRSFIPGNQAIHDQILALKWIQKNIAAFGGDPDQVTVFGESAGATSLRAMLSAPCAFGLYKNIAGESDPINIPFSTPAIAGQSSSFFMAALGCNATDLVCARSKSMNDILEAQLVSDNETLSQNIWTTYAMIQRPVADGSLLPADFSDLVKSGQYNTEANIMWGTNHDEAGFIILTEFPNVIPITTPNVTYDMFMTPSRASQIMNSPAYKLDPTDPDTVRDTFTRFGTDYYFFCPLRYLSREIAQSGHKRTWNFRFRKGRDTPFLPGNYCSMNTGRVCHTAEIQTVFASGSAIPLRSQTGDDARFARQVVDRWTTFAKTGNPNPQPGQVGFETENPDVTSVQWAPYDASNTILELNTTSAMSINNDPYGGCTWLESSFPYEFTLQNSS